MAGMRPYDQQKASFYILSRHNGDSTEKKLSLGTIFKLTNSNSSSVMIPLTSIEDDGNLSIETYETNVIAVKNNAIVPFLLAVEERPRRLPIIKNELWVAEACSLKAGDIVDIQTVSGNLMAAGKIVDFFDHEQMGQITTSLEVVIAKQLQTEFGRKCGFQNFKNTCVLSIDRVRKAAAGDDKIYSYEQVIPQKDRHLSKSSEREEKKFFMLKEDVYDHMNNIMYGKGTLVHYFGDEKESGEMKLILVCEEEGYRGKVLSSSRENLKEIFSYEFELYLAVKDLDRRRNVINKENWREEALVIQEGTMVDLHIKHEIHHNAGIVGFKGNIKGRRGLFFGIILKEKFKYIPRNDKDGKVDGETYFECEPGRGIFLSIGQIRKSSGEWQEVKPKRLSRNKVSPTTPEYVTLEPHKLRVGCRIRAKLDNSVEFGTLRWQGELKGFKLFGGKETGGIELDNSVGTGCGIIKGQKHFICAEKHGRYVGMNLIKHAYEQCPNFTFGERVIVPVKEKDETATVKWIGRLRNTLMEGIFVGVELDEPKGDNAGVFGTMFYFSCKAKHGKFVPAGKVKKIDGRGKTTPTPAVRDIQNPLLTATDIYSDNSNNTQWWPEYDTKIPRPNRVAKNEEIWMWAKKYFDLEIGDEVFLAQDEKKELGRVRWIGYLPKESKLGIHAGVEFYHKITSHDGNFKEKVIFPCDFGYGAFVPIQSLLKSSCVPVGKQVSDVVRYKSPMPQPGTPDSKVQLWVFDNLGLVKEHEVYVFKDGEADMMKGILKWMGHLPDAMETSKKIFAGVLLDKPEGNIDGSYRSEKLFTCKPKYGVLVPIDEILKANETSNDDKSSMPQPGATDFEVENWVKENLRLERGEEVLFCKDDREDLMKGTLKWLGYPPDATPSSNTIYAGIELDRPDGRGEGIYKTQRLFACKSGHGIFVPVDEILKAGDMIYEDLSELQNHSNDAYESLSKMSKDSTEKSVHGKTEVMKDHWSEVEKDHNGMGETDNGYRIQQLKDAQTAKHKSDSLDYSNENIYNEKPGTTIKLQGDTSDIRCINNESTMIQTMIGKQMDSVYYDAHSSFENKKQKVVPEDHHGTIEKGVRSTQPPRLEDISDNEMLYHCRGLEVGVAVEVAQKYPLYGTVRWIGKRISPGREDEYIAGIEAEEDYPGGTDGTFLKQRMFYCRPKRALFVRVTQCKRDTRFEEVPVSMPFGHRDTPDVEGYCEMPDFTKGVQNYCGTFKGIQGHHNSCYMDSTLFAMFFATEAFDQIFFREKQKGDSDTFEAVKNTLKHGIVNPLRKSGYVRADKVIKLRALLDQHGSVKGITNEEKDPEEFLNSLMNEVLQARPFIKLDSGQTSNMFQLFCEKDDDLVIPNVQQIVEQSFLQSGIKLAEIPKCLILQMPRFGKDYKLYQQIIPSLTLDITNILDGSHRLCVVCGKMAEVECPSCYKGFSTACISDVTFCKEDYATVHYHHKRKGHVPKDLHVKDEYKKSPVVHELFLTAVVCIETSHYVSFVKCDKTWIFFDSMADRKGEANGYNIPEIKECPELVDWLKPTDENIQRIIKTNPRDLPPSVRRVLGDAYLCLYQSNPDDMLYT